MSMTDLVFVGRLGPRPLSVIAVSNLLYNIM